MSKMNINQAVVVLTKQAKVYEAVLAVAEQLEHVSDLQGDVEQHQRNHTETLAKHVEAIEELKAVHADIATSREDLANVRACARRELKQAREISSGILEQGRIKSEEALNLAKKTVGDLQDGIEREVATHRTSMVHANKREEELAQSILELQEKFDAMLTSIGGKKDV